MSFGQVFTRHLQMPVRGVDVHVAEAGSGPAILFLHGNPDTYTVWDGVVERLAGSHRCIAPDLPGFGGSIAPADFDCSLESQAAFVGDLLTALGLERVHLVVHDVGGAYGLAFATSAPHRVHTLTILNTNFFPDYKWHFWARVWRTRVLGEIAMGIANRALFVREMRAGSPRIPREYALHAWEAFGRPTRRMVLRWYRAMSSEVYAGWDERFLAATASTPKQVLWGDLDVFIPGRIADRFGGVVHRVADAGHWVMLEDPDMAASAIARLVETHEGDLAPR